MEQLITRSLRLRPHHRESTGSRPITEVKSCRAASVPGWVTTWESAVLQTFGSTFGLFRNHFHRPARHRSLGLPNLLTFANKLTAYQNIFLFDYSAATLATLLVDLSRRRLS